MMVRARGTLRARDAEHRVVYRNDNEFCSWPFLCGFWETAEGHFLVGFMRNECTYDSERDMSHNSWQRTRTRLSVLRSEDRAASWNTSEIMDIYDLADDSEAKFGNHPHRYADEPALDFTDKNVLVASGAFPDYFLASSRAWIRVSTDGGRTWRRPIIAPLVKLASLSGHGSPVVRGDGVSLICMTAVSADGRTRRPVVYASVDDTSHWTFLSFMTPYEDNDSMESGESRNNIKFASHRWFDPRPILMPDGRIVASIRCQRDPTSVLWTEIWESTDGGVSWRFLSRVGDWGAPGDLALTTDGRLVCAYGYRIPPYGVRARVSEDGGRSWGAEIIIRDDGGSWDLGYPRVIEHEKGRLLVIYYMNRKDDHIQMGGGVRHIAQTTFALD